ncbi:MAG: hypothetical protein IJE59_02825 [Clostridia bacterium]|nr:hypothetical protein [Clostridia bacterium]
MNEMEQFLNFGAVVKINRSIDDDLLKFIELIKSVGFLKEYIESFEKSCCFDKEFNEFSESTFWHYVKINNGDLNNTCIEFQWSKGFTWGNKKDYLNYDSEMKILTVDELIIACNKEELFKMNGEYTTFKNELEDKESASELDDFLNFYEWAIYKYPDGKYNIKDTQCNTFDFDENTTFEQIIERVYFRMFDYFIDEEELEDENVKERYDRYIKVGENLKLLDEHSKQQYEKWYRETIQKDNENTVENDYNYN